MAKFYGVIGYAADAVETKPGVFTEGIVEYAYFGDVLRNSRQLREADAVNPDIGVQNSISIVADAYAREHFHAIRYVEWSGGLWQVADVTVEPPRLVLRLGGVYNGPRGSKADRTA